MCIRDRVKTDVRLVGSFPFQVTCSQVGLADTGHCMVVTFFKPGYAVDVVTLQIRVIAYTALVTGLSDVYKRQNLLLFGLLSASITI